MKKNLFAAALFLISGAVYSQVGINNQAPKATLDVVAQTTDGSKPEGLIAPRLTGDQIQLGNSNYGTAQKGTIIYATTAVTLPDSKTSNITAEGYYYFNGTLWLKVGSGGSGDGTNDSWVNDAPNAMVKLGTQSDGVTAKPAGTEFVAKDNGNIGVGTSAPDNSALLDVSSTTKGFLPPRMTNAQIALLSNPATGLMAYSLTDKCIKINAGTTAAPLWDCVAAQSTQGTAVVQVNSYTPNTAAGSTASEVCIGSICAKHDGAAAEGNIMLRSNTGATIPNTSVAGFQVAAGAVNQGNTSIGNLTIPYVTYNRGGASGGQFINYQVCTGNGENYKILLTMVASMTTPGAGNGMYLLNIERVK